MSLTCKTETYGTVKSGLAPGTPLPAIYRIVEKVHETIDNEVKAKSGNGFLYALEPLDDIGILTASNVDPANEDELAWITFLNTAQHAIGGKTPFYVYSDPGKYTVLIKWHDTNKDVTGGREIIGQVQFFCEANALTKDKLTFVSGILEDKSSITIAEIKNAIGSENSLGTTTDKLITGPALQHLPPISLGDLTRGITNANNTIPAKAKSDAQKLSEYPGLIKQVEDYENNVIPSLNTRVTDLENKVNDYHDNIVPDLEQQVADLTQEVADLNSALLKKSSGAAAAVVVDPTTTKEYKELFKKYEDVDNKLQEALTREGALQIRLQNALTAAK